MWHWWGLKEIIMSETRFEPRTPGWKFSATVSFQPTISAVPTLLPLSIITERIVHRPLHIHQVVGSNLSLGNIIHSWNLHLNSQPAASYCFVMVWICKRVVSSLEAVVPKRTKYIYLRHPGQRQLMIQEPLKALPLKLMLTVFLLDLDIFWVVGEASRFNARSWL